LYDQPIFCLKNAIGASKNAEFDANFDSIGKVEILYVVHPKSN
jgi:hypothetical protein